MLRTSFPVPVSHCSRRNTVEVDTYKGDNVNGFAVSERKPDPQRIVKGYFHSASACSAEFLWISQVHTLF